MRKILLVVASLMVSAVAAASDIPPNLLTVVTSCGTPVAVFTMEKGKIVKHDSPAAVASLASRAPFNLRVESGCRR